MLKTQRNTLHEVICEKFKNRQGLNPQRQGCTSSKSRGEQEIGHREAGGNVQANGSVLELGGGSTNTLPFAKVPVWTHNVRHLLCVRHTSFKLIFKNKTSFPSSGQRTRATDVPLCGEV